MPDTPIQTTELQPLDLSPTEPSPTGESPGYLPRQLVLLGAGHAHLHVLAQLATQPLVGARITLVAPHPRQMYAAMVPGYLAGHYSAEECTVALEPLVRRGGIRWLTRSVRALDAVAQTVQFDDGSAMHYDWLSVNTGPVINRNTMEKALPGARAHGLFVRPIDSFAALWLKVAQMGSQTGLRIAVIGAGATGLELAMAVRHRLPNAALTLLCGPALPGSGYSPAVQARLVAALKARRITIIRDTAVGLNGSAVLLESGATLACDVPLIATGAQAPPWLKPSGLALDAQGFVAVDAFQRSTSHANVFAAGDVSTRQDRELARSGVYAMRAGPAIAHNLRAVVAGQQPKQHQPPKNSLSLISCGDRYAIGSWGSLSFEGRWVWQLKNRIDRKFVASYAASGG